MPSTRRNLLRTGLLGVAGLLAGCSGSDAPTTGTTTGTVHRSHTTQSMASTTRAGTTETPTAVEETTGRPTTVAYPSRTIEFAHRTPVLESGITSAESDYFAGHVGIPQERDRLDVSAARGDVPGQDLAAVEEFVATTNYRETTLFVVQMRMPSPRYGLDFAFLDPGSPAQMGVRTRRENRGSGGGPVISTLLVRVPARTSVQLSVTVADVAQAFDPARTVTTFAPPHDLRAESLNAGSLDGFPTPSGALVASAADAKRLPLESDSAVAFVRETDFDRSYLLAVQTRIQSGGGFVWPNVVAREKGRVVVEIWEHPFTGGPSAEFGRGLLARLPGEAPERGTATLQGLGGSGDAIVDLSSDPDEWPATRE